MYSDKTESMYSNQDGAYLLIKSWASEIGRPVRIPQ